MSFTGVGAAVVGSKDDQKDFENPPTLGVFDTGEVDGG